MCVPSAVAGVSATASASSALFVVKSESTLTFGLNDDDRDGQVALALVEECPRGGHRVLIGAPFMLFDASMSRIAPLAEPPGGATATPVTGPPFSVTLDLATRSAPALLRAPTRYALSGNPDVDDSVSFGAGRPARRASVGTTSAATPRSRSRSAVRASRRCAPTLVERVKPLAEHALRELDATLAELLEEDGAEARSA